MVSQSSDHHAPSLGASGSRFLRIRWPHLRQKLSRHKSRTSAPIDTSSTTVDSSDTSLKYDIPALASGDLSYPLVEWGPQATPAVLRATLYKLLSKVAPQSAAPDDGNCKTHGTTSHQTRNKPEKAGNRRKSTSKGARDYGSAGGGKGGKGRGGGNGQPPPDGWRFPPLGNARPPNYLACPFHKTDPLRYYGCSNLRMLRPSDVSLHLFRKHLLREIRLELRRDTESIDRTETEEAVACTNANDITLYHARCRMEFHGPNAEENLRYHYLNMECSEVGIEDTGVILLSEYEEIISARNAENGDVAKWYAIWGVCYPPTSLRAVPASPYVGDETDANVQQILQDLQRQRGLQLQEASQSTSTSMHLPSADLDAWDRSLEASGLQHTNPFHSSSMTLPLHQYELLAGQPSNGTTTSPGSLPQQQSQLPYRTTFSSIGPSTVPLQPPTVQQPYQNTSSSYLHPELSPETSGPVSQQAMNWYWNNTTNWNPDQYGGSQ